MHQKLLRPRATRQPQLLPHHEKATPIATPPFAAGRWRWWLWLFTLLLLVGTLYCWNASRLQTRTSRYVKANLLGPEVLAAEDPREKDTAESSARTFPLVSSPRSELSAREVSVQAALALARAQNVEMQSKMTSTDKKEKKKVDARLKCRGWKATDDCDPKGARLPKLDLTCGKVVPIGQSGYCELEDMDSGEVFQVLKRNCDSVREDAKFRCLDAAEFVKFPIRAKEAAKKALVPGFALPHLVPNVAGVDAIKQSGTQDGIVMVVYPRLLASVYATIRVLRDVLGCKLPIEIWYRPDEMRLVSKGLAPLKKLAGSDATRRITFHQITDARAFAYGTKVHAIYHSLFERVLFLDADNVPVRDPSFLFDSPEFVETGAVFWPDFWHPGNTIFNIHRESLVWQLLDLPFIDMFEQESGQLLIDRRRHTAAIQVLSFYAFHRPNLLENFKLAHGDKDLFRFAWMHQNATYHMIQTPPAIAGKVVDDSFCGMTMVQHDAQGEVLFLHRNSHKLTGMPIDKEMNVRAEALAKVKKTLAAEKAKDGNDRMTPKWSEVQAEIADMEPAKTPHPEPDGYPDEIIWTHLLSFNNTAQRANYVVDSYKADPQFPIDQHCYGQRYIGPNPNFYAQEIANMSFVELETHLRRFAHQAAQNTRS